MITQEGLEARLNYILSRVNYVGQRVTVAFFLTLCVVCIWRIVT